MFKQATDDLILQSGETLIIYISDPDSISVSDVGLTVSVNVFTSQAMYYKEANVQATGGTKTESSTPAPDGLTITYVNLYYTKYNGFIDAYDIVMVLTNYGGDVTISLEDFSFDGQQILPASMGYYQASGLQATDDLPYLKNPDPIQGHTLTRDESSFTFNAGYTAIVYVCGTSSLKGGDVGTEISVGIHLGDSGGTAKTATVQAPQG